MIYILEDKVPVKATSFEAERWLTSRPSEKIVKQEVVGKYYVSTVFLMTDHRFNDKGPPILFESMVFPATEDGKIESYDDLYCDRCCTYEEAEYMHREAVEWAKNHD